MAADARRATHRRRGPAWHASAAAVTAIAGFVFVSGAVTSRGTDIRPAGGDVSSLVQERAKQVDNKRSDALELQQTIDELSAAVGVPGLDDLLSSVDAAATAAGLAPVHGAGLRISLKDAPRSSDASGVDPNVLVVHQQDIQGFVNALWAGGATAITLQGQRLVSTSGIKCVGSTVVIEGVPYSPPYVIEAVGTVSSLQSALDAAPEVTVYQSYARRYNLGLQITVERNLSLPGYEGPVDMRSADILEPS